MLRRKPAAALLLVVLAACGGSASGDGSSGARRVNQAQVELQLSLKAKERSPRLAVGKATCPAGVTARTGESFECSVDVEGQPVRYHVTISEILGDQAQYQFQPLLAIVDLSTVTDFLRSRLDEHWKTAKIDCGQARVRLADVGATIDCTVYDGTSTRYVQAVVEDRDGAVTLRER